MPVRAELIGYVEDQGLRQRQALRRQVSSIRDRLRAAAAALPRPLDLLATARQRVDLGATRLGAALRAFQHRKAMALAAVAPRLSLQALQRSIEQEARALDRARRRLDPAIGRLLVDRRQRLAAQAKLLTSLSYRGVLARGFALVTDEAGQLVRSAASIAPAQPLSLEFADGQVAVTAGVAALAPTPPVSEPPKPKRQPRASSEDGGQQSLF